MKRVLSILMSISMMLMLVVPVSASQPTIIVETVAEAVVPGETVTLTVSVENNPGFTNFDWKVNYDENFLSLEEFPEADINLPRAFSFVPNTDTAKVSSASDGTAYAEDGALFSIKFTVKDDAVDGDTDVSIEVAEGGAVANDGTPVEFTYVPSTISVDGIDDIPTGSQPTGSQPTGSQPTGSQPTGSQPTGSQPTGSQPTGSQPTGSQPTGSQPTGSQPTGSQPEGDLPEGSVVTSLGSGSQSKCTVTFELNEGTGTTKAVVGVGETLEQPEDPVKEGFKFIGWYVDAGLTKLYNFNTLVTENFTLYAKWVEEKKEEEEETQTGTGLAFTDVKAEDWFYEAVKFAFERNLVNGVSDTEFAPNAKVTRAALVEILYRLEGKPATDGSIPYEDVAMDKYYANAVIWADQNEIIKGISETEFAPEVNITREQIATIIYRYAKHNNYDISVVETTDLSSFNDADQISDYAVDAMKYAVGIGIIRGRSNSMLAPKDYASRAEFVQILYNFFK